MPHAWRLLVVFSLACAAHPDELLIVDADAGDAHAGVIFSSTRGDEGWRTPTELCRDPRLVEPVDILVRSDGSLLVLDADARAIFHLDATLRPWWEDDRCEKPVAMARTADGTIYVSDRDVPCVFRITPDGTGVIADERFVTPSALLVTSDDRVLLMDADANPNDVVARDGRPATPGVLFEIRGDEVIARIEPSETTSPVGLIERRPGEIYLVDANAGEGPAFEGAVFRLHDGRLQPVAGEGLVDPTTGEPLPDGRLAVADPNADPLGLGDDGTGKGVGARGRGAVMAIDPDRGTVATLVADERFRTPLRVRLR